jgi:HSP20 family protein
VREIGRGLQTLRVSSRQPAMKRSRRGERGWHDLCSGLRVVERCRPAARTVRHGERRPRSDFFLPQPGAKIMSIVRWDPFRELEDVSERLNRVFGRSNLARDEIRDPITAASWVPSVDVSETPEEFQIKAELPEVKKDDVRVSVNANVLRIEGERKQEKEEKNKKYHRIERSYGSFLRTFTLPDNVDDSKVQAEFKEGVLSIRVPKSEKAKAKSVQIQIT